MDAEQQLDCKVAIRLWRLQSWWCAPAPVRAPVAAADALDAVSPSRANSALLAVDAEEDDILLHEMVRPRLMLCTVPGVV